MNSGMHQFGRRTNSLAFAKHDCHTCAALKRKCDRRRPYCRTCQSGSKKCEGFAMDLVWKSPPSLEPAKVQQEPVAAAISVHHHTEWEDEDGDGDGDAGLLNTFKFVNGRPLRRRQRGRTSIKDKAPEQFLQFRLDTALSTKAPRRSPDKTAFALPAEDDGATPCATDWMANDQDADTTSSSAPDPSPESVTPPTDSLTPETIDSSKSSQDYQLELPTIGSPPSPEISRSYFVREVLPSTPDPICIDELSSGVSEHLNGFYDLSGATVISTANRTGLPNSAELWEIPPTVQFRNLAHKYSSLLTMFNEEYCVVPLSIDCRSNPFRAREDFAESFPFLLHAVMAITCHHLGRKHQSTSLEQESFHHWSTAVQTFGSGLSSAGLLPLLDTLLILINHESTQSVYGTLDMHIGGAKTLLEQGGGLEKFHKSPRLRAQVAMLVWWDVTSSLIARRRPRLANTYLGLLQGCDDSDGWSFVKLTGCPISFVVAMSRLAELAEDYESNPEARLLVSQEAELAGILREAEQFVLDDPDDLDFAQEDAEDPDKRQNRIYCVEAWRHATLLYACRVFRQRQDLQGMRAIKHHARIILDSARCIPPADSFQKQLLLPVFLAGAEAGDDFNRDFVRQYCEHWTSASNFDQFRGAEAVLNSIWSEWSPWTRDTYWWGVKTTRTLDEPDIQGLSKQLLLG